MSGARKGSLSGERKGEARLFDDFDDDSFRDVFIESLTFSRSRRLWFHAAFAAKRAVGHPRCFRTRTSSMSNTTVLSVSPSPLASRVGLKIVVYSLCRLAKSRGTGSCVLSW